MTRVYYKDAVGAFLVYDLTRAESFKAVERWKADLDSKVTEQKKPCRNISDSSSSSSCPFSGVVVQWQAHPLRPLGQQERPPEGRGPAAERRADGQLLPGQRLRRYYTRFFTSMEVVNGVSQRGSRSRRARTSTSRRRPASSSRRCWTTTRRGASTRSCSGRGARWRTARPPGPTASTPFSSRRGQTK